MVTGLKYFILCTTTAIFLLSCERNSIYKAALIQQEREGTREEVLMAELGHHLFFDHELSVNSSKSCSSCHFPELYFTDGYRQTLGSYADVQLRNTPTLINVAEHKSYNWANPSIQSIEQQMLTPLFSKEHFEMGLDSQDRPKAVHILNKYPKFKELTKKYEKKEWACIIDCIALYVRLLNSRQAKYDLFMADKVELTPTEARGLNIFFSDSLNCGLCHGGDDFNSPIGHLDRFQNIGVPSNTQNDMDYGLYLETGKEEDRGKFRIPTLRNVAMTAPYMHNGSIKDLTDVIAHYEKSSPEKNSLLKGFQLSDEDKKCLIDFLNTLTDTTIRHNPLFNKP